MLCVQFILWKTILMILNVLPNIICTFRPRFTFTYDELFIFLPTEIKIVFKYAFSLFIPNVPPQSLFLSFSLTPSCCEDSWTKGLYWSVQPDDLDHHSRWRLRLKRDTFWTVTIIVISGTIFNYGIQLGMAVVCMAYMLMPAFRWP